MACASDQCEAGPWCCEAGGNGGGGNGGGGPDARCNGLRNTGLSCAGNATLIWCDEAGQVTEYACGQDGRVCATDDCTIGPWCCDPPPAQQPVPNDGGGEWGAADCSDACQFARDGVCDDGGPGAAYSACAYGTDCSDCGQREPNGGGAGNGGGGAGNGGGAENGGGAGAQCDDTCAYAYDGACDDGGAGSEFNVCALGTDCGDCGSR